MCVCVCVFSLLLHPSVECGSVRALVIVADRARCRRRGGGLAHSGQRARAGSMELQTAQPVSQPDNQHTQSHDSISELAISLMIEGNSRVIGPLLLPHV